MFSRVFLSCLVAKAWMMIITAPTYRTATIQVPSTNREPPCTGSLDWLGPGMDASDCAAAIDKFFDIDVARYGLHNFEFTSAGRKRKTGFPPMPTPRRYTVGKLSPHKRFKNAQTRLMKWDMEALVHL